MDNHYVDQNEHYYFLTISIRMSNISFHQKKVFNNNLTRPLYITLILNLFKDQHQVCLVSPHKAVTLTLVESVLLIYTLMLISVLFIFVSVSCCIFLNSFPLDF